MVYAVHTYKLDSVSELSMLLFVFRPITRHEALREISELQSVPLWRIESAPSDFLFKFVDVFHAPKSIEEACKLLRVRLPRGYDVKYAQAVFRRPSRAAPPSAQGVQPRRAPPGPPPGFEHVVLRPKSRPAAAAPSPTSRGEQPRAESRRPGPVTGRGSKVQAAPAPPSLGPSSRPKSSPPARQPATPSTPTPRGRKRAAPPLDLRAAANAPERRERSSPVTTPERRAAVADAPAIAPERVEESSCATTCETPPLRDAQRSPPPLPPRDRIGAPPRGRTMSPPPSPRSESDVVEATPAQSEPPPPPPRPAPHTERTPVSAVAVAEPSVAQAQPTVALESPVPPGCFRILPGAARPVEVPPARPLVALAPIAEYPFAVATPAYAAQSISAPVFAAPRSSPSAAARAPRSVEAPRPSAAPSHAADERYTAISRPSSVCSSGYESDSGQSGRSCASNVSSRPKYKFTGETSAFHLLSTIEKLIIMKKGPEAHSPLYDKYRISLLEMSLGGYAMECFQKLRPQLTTWNEIAGWFNYLFPVTRV